MNANGWLVWSPMGKRGKIDKVDGKYSRWGEEAGSNAKKQHSPNHSFLLLHSIPPQLLLCAAVTTVHIVVRGVFLQFSPFYVTFYVICN